MRVIIGGGLSGLICGALNAQAEIYERNKSDFVSHRAVLRFRDDKIAKALGLHFRKVIVRKAIYVDGVTHSPSPCLANLYSMKVRGVIADNSIWNLASAERFIAPDDLHAILAAICGKRVHWETDITLRDINQWHSIRRPIVSTIPVPVLLSILGVLSPLAFSHAPILVSRYHVPDCDVFQTVYFPDPSISVYRATLTGDLLTVERTDGPRLTIEDDMVAEAFGLPAKILRPDPLDLVPVEFHRQSFGKIAPVPDGPRKSLIHALTQDWGIYSVGRFALWKNILLDDVFDDIAIVRRLMYATSYDQSVERAKQ